MKDAQEETVATNGNEEEDDCWVGLIPEEKESVKAQRIMDPLSEYRKRGNLQGEQADVDVTAEQIRVAEATHAGDPAARLAGVLTVDFEL